MERTAVHSPARRLHQAFSLWVVAACLALATVPAYSFVAGVKNNFEFNMARCTDAVEAAAKPRETREVNPLCIDIIKGNVIQRLSAAHTLQGVSDYYLLLSTLTS